MGQARVRARVITGWLLVHALGCGDEAIEPASGDVLRTTMPPPSAVELACWAVGVIQATCEPKDCPADWQCPDELGPGWQRQGGRMFTEGTQALANIGLVEDELPAHLRRFCFYRASAPGLVLDPEESQLPASVDCPVAAAQSTSLEQALQPWLEQLFLQHADAVPDTLVPGDTPVDIAVVDTHSDRSWSWPSVAHARVVERVAQTIACPWGGCGGESIHALALPIDRDGTSRDPFDGSYGTRAHVAIGIVEAVTDFRRRLAADKYGTRRLVVNLSVGWTAEIGTQCGAGEDRPWCNDHVEDIISRLTSPTTGGPASLYATESLHAALLYASCSGALIVAAAGNAREDSCNAQPVAPATWGHYFAPTEADCEALGFAPPPGFETLLPASRDAAWPLVTAISAESPSGEPIAATRPGSMTPLVAPGWHVAIAGELPLSGTSISAAAVSGAAALVWSQAPELDPGDVVQQLYDNGEHAGRSSELSLYRWTVGTPVRRLRACAAQPSGTGWCTDPSEVGGTLANLASVAETEAMASVSIEYDVLHVGLEPDDCSACGSDAVAWLPPTPDATEEEWFVESCKNHAVSFTFDTRAELAGPQPNVPICPHCPLVVQTSDWRGRAYLKLDPSYLDPSLTWVGANLVLVDRSRKRHVIDLPVSSILADITTGSTVAVQLDGDWPDLSSATMNAILFDSTTSSTMVRGNELMLVYR